MAWVYEACNPNIEKIYVHRRSIMISTEGFVLSTHLNFGSVRGASERLQELANNIRLLNQLRHATDTLMEDLIKQFREEEPNMPCL